MKNKSIRQNPKRQKAIENSHGGFGIAAEEKFIRLTLPLLSEERRREIIRTLGKKAEEARITIRRMRDQAQKSIEEAFRAKEISEDEKFRSKEALQKIIDTHIGAISSFEKRKTEEIEG